MRSSRFRSQSAQSASPSATAAERVGGRLGSDVTTPTSGIWPVLRSSPDGIGVSLLGRSIPSSWRAPGRRPLSVGGGQATSASGRDGRPGWSSNVGMRTRLCPDSPTATDGSAKSTQKLLFREQNASFRGPLVAGFATSTARRSATRRLLMVVVMLLTFSATTSVGSSADAASSCSAVSLANGTRAVEVRAAGTSCRVARSVVAGWGRDGDGRTRDVRGRAWRCRTVQAATGTEPGSVARTKVRCARGRSVVRFAVRS